jgi:RimJ/RimL family protein N-acetyltransferase
MDDLGPFAEFFADPETMKHIATGATFDLEESRASLERMMRGFETNGFGQLAVERKDDGALIGRSGLQAWDPETWEPVLLPDATGPVEIEVGYLLGRDFWGHGYATEAATAVRDWALANLELDRLIALIQRGNERSAGVARKLGMEPDGEIEMFGRAVTVYALTVRP